MLHKIYDLFGWERDQTLNEKEQEVGDIIDVAINDNKKLMDQNIKLMEENTKMKEEKQIPPLKVTLRSTRKKRPWCWGPIMMLMAFIQTILVASGKQRSARRHLIALLKELEYYYGFRFMVIENKEKNVHSDKRRG